MPSRSLPPMCGICGSTRDPQATAVVAMNAAMVRRGPDDEGVYSDSRSGVALGARRLSIIDPGGGHQPVGNEDGSVWAVLNGEIYNHPDLRARLRSQGHRLATMCDTEVLVHLYEDFGDGLVHALEGMYAFAIWDARRQRMLLGRDRFGEKPLFYAEPEPGVLTFASDLSALLAGADSPAAIDPIAIDRFFVYGYLPGPRSMAKGVWQLPPGHLLSWSSDAPRVALTRYWEPPAREGDGSSVTGEAVAEARRLLELAVQSRMISDVPLGVFLSGGVDSTLIAALAARASPGRIKTFTVGYDTGAVGETDAAAATAAELGTEHHEYVMGDAEVASSVPRLLRELDQPIADQALVPLHVLAKHARPQVKVAVGGEGADELFGGYPRYRWLCHAERLGEVLPDPIGSLSAWAVEQLPFQARGRRLADVLRPGPSTERHLDWVTAGRRHLREGVYGPALRDQIEPDLAGELDAIAGNRHGELARRHMILDQKHWLVDDVLSKADRAGMLASLEIRTPYLQRELAEFAASVPAEVHLQRGGKALLRAVLSEVLPASRRPRRKRAFNVPVDDWLRGPLKPLIGSQLEGGLVFDEGLIQRDAMRVLADEHASGARDWSHVLWPLLSLGVWFDGWRDRHGG